MEKFDYPNLLNYIDNLIYIGLPSNIHISYEFLLQLLNEFDLEISQNKLVPPVTAVLCFGILVDSVNQTISILDQKLPIYVNPGIIRLCVLKTNFNLSLVPYYILPSVSVLQGFS